MQYVKDGNSDYVDEFKSPSHSSGSSASLLSVSQRLSLDDDALGADSGGEKVEDKKDEKDEKKGEKKKEEKKEEKRDEEKEKDQKGGGDEGYINFEKMKLIWKTLDEILRHSPSVYDIQENKTTQSKILAICPLDYDILYEFSCNVVEKFEEN